MIVYLLCLFLSIIAFVRVFVMPSQNTTDSEIKDSIFPEHNDISYQSYVSSRPVRTKNTHAKIISESKTYPIVHNNFGFNHNMNCHYYQASAKYSKTNRKRTVKHEAFSPEEMKQYMLDSGFLEPIEIQEIDFPPATEAQLSAMHKHNEYYENICKEDASAIISKNIENDSNPNPELLEYATEKKIVLSYYIGKKALYDDIFFRLGDIDKIAFFAFCMYRFYSNDRNSNLNKSPHKDLFYKYAERMKDNTSFIKSMCKHTGRDLRFWGDITVRGITYSGTSRNTIAHKETYAYLKETHLIH